jgi:hypothetical protein
MLYVHYSVSLTVITVIVSIIVTATDILTGTAIASTVPASVTEIILLVAPLLLCQCRHYCHDCYYTIISSRNTDVIHTRILSINLQYTNTDFF